jgi:hypothetical protein
LKEADVATLCRAYPSVALARRAVAGLRTAGLPPQGAQLIFGARLHDRRREPMGEFAGPAAAPDAPVGTFGNVTLQRWRPGGAFAGDADRQRQGSFADVDQHVIVSHDPGGRAHDHVMGQRGVQALLRAAGLDREATGQALADLAAGRALVLVQIAEMGPAAAARRLEEAQAAA